MADILCVGQMVADIIVSGVDEIDFAVDTTRIEKISVSSGGDALNNAVALGKLGANVGFVGAAGRDPYGEFLRNTLVDNRVDVRGMIINESHATSSAIVLLSKTGERIFLYYGGANDHFEFQQINQSIVKEAKIVHVGGTFLLPSFDGVGAKQLFELCRKNDILTSMDVTWDTAGKWMLTIEPCLPYLDLFMPSINEAKEICGTSDPVEIANVLKGRGVRNVIVKLGKDGSYVDAFGKKYYQKAYAVPVVDTTGAGDSFVAGVLFGINEGWPIEETTKFASAVSAHCIQEIGATEGIVSAREILQFISKN